MARKDWIKLPMEVFTQGLKPTEACVLAVLIDRAKNNGWTAKITRSAIAEQLNISVRTVQTALDWLERFGYIQSTRSDRASYYDIAEKAQISSAPKKQDEPASEADEYTEQIKHCIDWEERKFRQLNICG